MAKLKEKKWSQMEQKSLQIFEFFEQRVTFATFLR